MQEGRGEDQFNRSLYQGMPIRRDIDPESYDSKYNYWSQRILQLQNDRKEASFTLNELQTACTSRGFLPLALPAVIKIMEEKNLITKQGGLDTTLQRRGENMSWKIARYMLGWIRSPPPLGLHDMLLLTQEMRNQCLIIWKLVRDQIVHDTDWLVTEQRLQEFYQAASDQTPFELLGRSILLAYMEIQKIAVPVLTPRGELVGYKFLLFDHSFEWECPHKYSNVPQQVDTHILILRRTIENTEKRERAMTERISGARQQALEYNGKKQKKVALLYMKRFNVFQDKLAELVMTKHKLEDLYMSIQGAQTNVQLADSYRAANSALSSVMNGLDVDQVDEIILSLEDSIERQQRIEGAMSFTEIDPTEQDELEAELDQLAQELNKEDLSTRSPTPAKPVLVSPSSVSEDSSAKSTIPVASGEEDLDEMIAELADMSVCKDQLDATPQVDSSAQ